MAKIIKKKILQFTLHRSLTILLSGQQALRQLAEAALELLDIEHLSKSVPKSEMVKRHLYYMHIHKKIFKKSNLIIAYKLLHDLLFLVLLAFALSLVSEGLLPGLVTDHISFSKIVFALILIMGAIVYLGKNFDITYQPKKINKIKILPILILFTFLVIGNSMLLFALWQNILITLATLFIFFLFHELFFSHQA